MKNLLAEWARAAKSALERQGFHVRVSDTGLPQRAVSVDLDGDQFVGGVTHWAPDLFELQFNDVTTGEVILLETVKLGSVEEIDAYIMTLFEARLGLKRADSRGQV